jgi:hypothetical protein
MSLACMPLSRCRGCLIMIVLLRSAARLPCVRGHTV